MEPQRAASTLLLEHAGAASKCVFFYNFALFMPRTSGRSRRQIRSRNIEKNITFLKYRALQNARLGNIRIIYGSRSKE
jgi:hypothetical protein